MIRVHLRSSAVDISFCGSYLFLPDPMQRATIVDATDWCEIRCGTLQRVGTCGHVFRAMKHATGVDATE
jgi:hypothetical protein